MPPHEVYEASVDSRRAVYKGDTGPTGNAAVEGRVTALVGRETAVPVPETLRVGDDCYVTAWHPDAPAPDSSDEADEAWAAAAGRGLATLHTETEPLVDGCGPFRAADGGVRVETADDWHAAAVDHVRHRRSVLAEYGHADVADAAVEFLRDRPDAFDGAGDPVCCHGWWTPEHVAVEDGRVACVVDFEHATAAPGEWDYWRTVTPTFAACDEDTTAARRAFRRGYESVRPFSPGFERRRPYYGLLNGVYYLQSLYVQDRHGPAATAERAARFRARIFETISELDRGRLGRTAHPSRRVAFARHTPTSVMSRFDAVLFDLDGTLCENEQDVEHLYFGAFERAEVEPFGAPSDLWAVLEGPPTTPDEFEYYREGFRTVAAEHGRAEADVSAVAREFVDGIDYGAVSLLGGAEAALADAGVGHRVGLMTNGPEYRQSVKLEALGLEDAFEVVVYAGDMERRKPHTDPFDRAVEALGVDASATLYVGNSLKYDVAGAREAGLPVAWYPDGDADPGSYDPDYVVESLAELADVLDGTVE